MFKKILKAQTPPITNRKIAPGAQKDIVSRSSLESADMIRKGSTTPKGMNTNSQKHPNDLETQVSPKFRILNLRSSNPVVISRRRTTPTIPRKLSKFRQW